MNEKASGAQAIEQRAHEMLLTAYGSGPLEVFGNADQPDEQEGERLATSKAAADLLVNSRFAKYADEGRTQIELTNAGRYWALNGGFLAFLKEEPAGRGGGRGRIRKWRRSAWITCGSASAPSGGRSAFRWRVLSLRFCRSPSPSFMATD
jgi:hypothetical protein